MEAQQRMEQDRAMVEAQLAEHMDSIWPYGHLAEAMAYSLLGGGKRIRAILTLAAYRFCGGTDDKALQPACALEMIHAYSLIHDDLPAMDDDDLRRGKPSCHKVYGEAVAILAGDALLTEAFSLLAAAPGLSDATRVEGVALVSKAAGSAGMVGGQVLDMEKGALLQTVQAVQMMESLKTGALFVAALDLGALVAGADADRRALLRSFGEKLGLVFQLRDDILDHIGTEEELGKPLFSDLKGEKMSLVAMLGLQGAEDMLHQIANEMLSLLPEELAPVEETAFLRALTEMLRTRRS